MAPEDPPEEHEDMNGTNNDDEEYGDNDDFTQEEMEKQKRLEDLEAKAVAEAKANADAAFKPSPSLLNASSAEVLMSQVDGPPLTDYEGKESVYVGRSVPVSAGGRLSVPIQVTTPGSIVEYAVEIKAYDLGVAITAERDEGTTIVKRAARVNASESPLTQKFLVGTVPCLINFMFDNEFSWMREKVVSYKVTVTPPSTESLAAGRRRRAKACLKAVDDDLKSTDDRLKDATINKEQLESDVADLEKQLEEKKQSLEVAEDEESQLQERVDLRNEQRALLIKRLEHGWDDENSKEEIGGAEESDGGTTTGDE